MLISSSEHRNNENIRYIAVLSLECKSCSKIIDSFNYYINIKPVIYYNNKYTLNYNYYSLLNIYEHNLSDAGVYNFIELIKIVKNFSIKKQYSLIESMLKKSSNITQKYDQNNNYLSKKVGKIILL